MPAVLADATRHAHEEILQMHTQDHSHAPNSPRCTRFENPLAIQTQANTLVGDHHTGQSAAAQAVAGVDAKHERGNNPFSDILHPFHPNPSK
jgi:hypothetical protein